jgi:hypothetical protein
MADRADWEIPVAKTPVESTWTAVHATIWVNGTVTIADTQITKIQPNNKHIIKVK